ncbi:hypothetical protein ACFE04_009630 [Oxalis oulophora]
MELEKSVECDQKAVDDVLLPGFRFHPTDEELVGFYLKRKVLQKSLPIELIKQVDIYKHDPWDLPSLATTGEKEWYFYCPRDRKYRNSARPNRVTGSGFWKATGTDRPIYSSDSSNCIGLKKSLVFYRGRAAKGLKTDWMMHEFRLPSLSESAPPKKFLDKTLPPNDAWAICRIFKKTNSMAQRALTNSWMTALPESGPHGDPHYSQFTSEIGQIIQLNSNNDLQASNFCALDIPSYNKAFNPAAVYKPSQPSVWNGEIPGNFMFSTTAELSETTKRSDDGPCMTMNQNLFGEFNKGSESIHFVEESQQIRSFGFPFSLPSNLQENAWKSNFEWESQSCPSEISTNKCYVPSE